VTYRASTLRSDLLAASDAVIVKRESNPQEVRAPRALCGSCTGAMNEDQSTQLFESLVPGEAVALPITEEAEGYVRRIHLAPGLTPQIRHLIKYLDLPAPERAHVHFLARWGTHRTASSNASRDCRGHRAIGSSSIEWPPTPPRYFALDRRSL
jgi:hypothetical protein